MKKIPINKRNSIVIVAVATVIAILLVLLSTFATRPLSPLPTSKKVDKFGIREIYPTKPGGREWFISMENPGSDGVFDPQSKISRQPDDSWRIGGKQTAGRFYDEVRMNVNTPVGAEDWRRLVVVVFYFLLDFH